MSMDRERKAGPSLVERVKEVIAQREFSLFLVLLVIGIFMASSSPVFFTWANAEAILLALSVDAIIAVGMVVLLISGGLDLSVGSTLALTGVVTGLLLNAGQPAWAAILFGLLTAVLVGLGNGLLVARLKINPFITTLGMTMMLRGLLLVLAKGKAVLNLPESFTVIGQGRLFSVQYPIYIMLVLVIAGEILVRNTRFFRQSYYIGGSEKLPVARASASSWSRFSTTVWWRLWPASPGCSLRRGSVHPP
jgi:ribose transport system permease protein